ncbi:MAG TPA: DUF4388 domain-containing protein [Ktedonobacteraceae bacterium]|nr:DUF4388 domain-containing protein [Ktedonobacteraceae bacterium]
MTITHAVLTERLVDILHMAALRGQTGLLFVQRVNEQQMEQGEIFFENGDTVFARMGGETGEAALSQMMNWKEARISFHEGVVVSAGLRQQLHIEPRSSSISSMLPIELQKTRMMQATARAVTTTREPLSQTPISEIPAILPGQQAVPGSLFGPRRAITRNAQLSQPVYARNGQLIDAESVYQVLPEVAAEQIIHRLDRRARLVFLLLDGKRSLREVAGLIHRSEVEVARSLAYFLALGLIERIVV